MLLARFAPVDSKRYESLSEKAKILDKVVERLSPQLFAIWTIFVIGMSVGKAKLDRFYFWDWSDWLIGIVGILLITIILNLIKSKFGQFPYKSHKYSLKDRVFHAFFSLLLMILGFALTSGFNSVVDIIVYLLPYVSIFVIYTIEVDTDSNMITKESYKHLKSMGSTLLLIIAIVIGSINDDPLLATASMVTLPFIVVLLFGNHIRHLERAKFYPIFIFAMFVSSREAWFIIPIFLLFHFLRSYNYLVYQNVYPTFGVSE